VSFYHLPVIRIAGIVIDEALIRERFIRSPGPGGQNVNKVATSVELRFDVGASGLPDDVKSRLHKLAGHRLTADGVLVIHAHEHRTQTRNREAARERLVGLLRQAGRKPTPRRATKAPVVAHEHRLASKHLRSRVKKRRGRSPGSDEE
jgi:ribosome-associated protein